MVCNRLEFFSKFFNEPKFKILYTSKCFQVLLCIANNSIKNQSFVYA